MDKIESMMNIVVCTDHNYVMPCGVMLYSLCKNSATTTIVFNVIIDDSVSDKDKDLLSQSKGNNSNVEIVYYPIDGKLFENFPNLGKGVYVSKATYYRLYLAEILPESIDKVLYLDCDMIVRKDLEDLWNTNIDEVAVAAVMDGMDGLVQLYNRLGYPMEKGYFNAGVLLVNLKYWRDNRINEKCLDYMKNNYNRIVSHDQDILNYVLQDSKKSLNLTYNFGESFLYKPQYMQFYYAKYKTEIDAAINDPAIVHYTISKPWKMECLNPFKKLFFIYKNQSIWKNREERKQFNLRKAIKNLLIMAGLKQKEPNKFDIITFEIS